MVIEKNTPTGHFAGIVRSLVNSDDKGLSLRQMAMVLYAYENPPVGTLALATAMQMPGPTASRNAERLIAAGLLSRTPSTMDRRRVALSITEAGIAFVDGLALHDAQ